MRLFCCLKIKNSVKMRPFPANMKIRVDFRRQSAKFTRPFMKNDLTTTLLNLALAALVILGVLFAILSMNYTRQLRQLTTAAAQANQNLVKAQSLANDVAAYNATAKSPELTRILQAVQPKSATH